jgi:hypothetical protein
MVQEKIIAEIEQRALTRGVAIGVACKRAGFAPSTFYRWKGGAIASFNRIYALSQAIDDIAKERAA